MISFVRGREEREANSELRIYKNPINPIDWTDHDLYWETSTLALIDNSVQFKKTKLDG